MALNSTVGLERTQLKNAVIDNVDINPPSELLVYDNLIKQFPILELFDPNLAETLNSNITALDMANKIAMSNSLKTAMSSLGGIASAVPKLVDLKDGVKYHKKYVGGITFVYPTTSTLPNAIGGFNVSLSASGNPSTQVMFMLNVDPNIPPVVQVSSTDMQNPIIYLDKNGLMRFTATNLSTTQYVVAKTGTWN